MFFSHETPRPQQLELIETIKEAIENKKHVVAHAPTGLGKTAAAICPAIEFAMKRDLTVFFLTSRHTQHKIVLETVDKLSKLTGTKILATSLIGKKWMCGQENVNTMRSGDFTDYCKTLVENNQCEFYENARGKNNLRAKNLLAQIKVGKSLPAEELFSVSIREKVCPYEIALMTAENAKVIIGDYYYLFHPHIRESMLGKIKKKLEQCIIIVDEAHNLAGRLRDVLTARTSNSIIKYAIGEAKKHGFDDCVSHLVEILEIVQQIGAEVRYDKLIKEEDIVARIQKIKDYDELITEFNLAAEIVRTQDKSSHIGSVAQFLESWRQKNPGFARIIKREIEQITISNRCLDPALVTKDVFDNCYSAIVMSGTLNPTSMYADILGLQKAVQRSFKSPFPETNKLPLIIPRTTTKFTQRSDAQFKNIGKICSDIANKIPGCVMLFFPSYHIRDLVAEHFCEDYKKQVFFEKQKLSKEDKEHLLKKFASSAKDGAALLGVAAGSFGEGVDLPGVLKGVIVAGLPLDKPDLETTQLIEYYDKKFGKGWEYGYTLPAMTKCIQNAGRCIESETDRGVIVFLDERYAWPRYKSCFPNEWNMKITLDYEAEIARFFGKLW